MIVPMLEARSRRVGAPTSAGLGILRAQPCICSRHEGLRLPVGHLSGRTSCPLCYTLYGVRACHPRDLTAGLEHSRIRSPGHLALFAGDAAAVPSLEYGTKRLRVGNKGKAMATVQ